MNKANCPDQTSIQIIVMPKASPSRSIARREHQPETSLMLADPLNNHVPTLHRRTRVAVIHGVLFFCEKSMASFLPYAREA
jgi:hypothetical protein